MMLQLTSNFKDQDLHTDKEQVKISFEGSVCLDYNHKQQSLKIKSTKSNYSKIFENIFDAADHQHKDTGIH